MPVRSVLCRAGWVLGLLLGLAGCSGLGAADLPTPFPTEYLPTVVAMTIEAGRIKPQEPEFLLRTVTPTSADQSSLNPPTATFTYLEPAVTPTPGQSLPSSTAPRRPSATPSATPGVPNAQVQILDPGPMSVVVSPLYLNAYLRAIPSGSLHIELWREPRQCGEEAQPLVRDVQRFNASPSPWVYVTQDLEFEVPGASVLGRVQVSTLDEHGRLVASASSDVILLAMGEADLNPSASLLAPINIQEPSPNKLIQGGSLQVSGEANVSSDESLLIELVARDGKVVGYRQAFVVRPSGGGYGTFSSEVPYTVTEATWARVTVKELSTECIPGILSAASLEVLLSP